jgi:hypothetical protein
MLRRVVVCLIKMRGLRGKNMILLRGWGDSLMMVVQILRVVILWVVRIGVC